jgi:propanol-preferring alcohol dehydrogenase
VYATCGVCPACRRGEENLCPQITFTGYHVDGGYAEWMVAREDYVYPLPASFDDTAAAPLLCAGIIGYRSLRLSGIRPGEHLGLFGFGASAHLAIQVARHWGCTVSVFTRSAAHRRLAEQLGAVWVGESQTRAPHELDAAVVFAPVGRIVVDALRQLRRGGTVAINAVHLDQMPAFDYEWLYWERVLRSVSNSTRQDGLEFLALAAQIPITVETQLFPLTEANRALAALKRGGIQGAAVLDPRAAAGS